MSTSPLGANTALDRRMARRDFGMKLRIGDDLLAQVGRRGKHDPVFAVGAHGDAALRPLRGQAAVALIGETAILAQAVPLREAAAGRGSKHQKLHVIDPIPAVAPARSRDEANSSSCRRRASIFAARGKLERSYALIAFVFALVRPPRENRHNFATARAGGADEALREKRNDPAGRESVRQGEIRSGRSGDQISADI